MIGNILILSEDAVFARMLELEFTMMRFLVQINQTTDAAAHADLILVDLDSATVPDQTADGARIIGFTANFEVSQMDASRRCSMILHRPFEMRILREEVELLSTSFQGREQPFAPQKHNALSLKGNLLTLGDATLNLRPKEAAVISCLLQNRSQAISREEICRVIGESSANKADVYICYLRRKLLTVTERPMIKTVRGKGYRID